MNDTLKTSTRALLLATGLALGAGSVLASSASTSNPASGVVEQQIRQADSLAQSGREALSYIVAAGKLLSDQHTDETRHYLEQARDLLKQVESRLSTGKQDKPSDLLPVYSQLGIKKDVEITDQLRQKLEHVHLDMVQGRHQSVVEKLKTVGIELQYSFVDLPVSATLAKVESALKYLSAQKTRQAGEALADAQAGLIHDSIIVDAVDENPAG